ncbi:MAG: DUF881 domain-containing protein [Buchananella hordeovulneris]|nr:DUF881 domain-containing protein [Buchananella hordeovulneris]
MQDSSQPAQEPGPGEPTRRSVRDSLRLRKGPGRLSIHDPRRLDTTQLRVISAPLRHETRVYEQLDVEAIAVRAQGRGAPRVVFRRWLRAAFARPRFTWNALAVPVVMLLAAALITANIGTYQDREPSEVRDLASLAQSRSARHREAEARNEALRAEVRRLVAAEPAAAGPQVDTASALAAGRLAATGPGVRVQLWDAKVPAAGPGEFSNDDYVVHQSDIEGVLNGLREGGAEAISVQGHRVVSTTSIRCVGNVLYIDGYHYSPPYVIEAVGEPDRLMRAVESSKQVQIYLQYVKVLGLGWELSPVDSLNVVPHRGANVLLYAKVSE